MFVLALIPLLRYRYMKQVLAEWDESMQLMESENCYKINKQAGCELYPSEQKRDDDTIGLAAE